MAALPPPPSFTATPSTQPSAPITADFDNVQAKLFAREYLGSIVHECVRACQRTELRPCATDELGCSDNNLAASHAFVEQLVLWMIKAQELGWFSDSDGLVQGYMKMLWGIRSSHAHDIAIQDAADCDQPMYNHAPKPSITPSFLTSASSSSSSLLSLPPSQLAAIHACLLASTGDTHRVISAAEGMHCRFFSHQFLQTPTIAII
jgi:hypothetical protein